jgi:hypothetical protein
MVAATKFCESFHVQVVGIQLIWQGPSVVVQNTRGPEGLSTTGHQLEKPLGTTT